MARFTWRLLLIAGGALALVLALVLALAAPAAAQPSYVPNLQSGPGGWTHPFGGAFPPVQGSALPVRQDPGHPFVNPVQSFRFGDLSNPNLKQWAKEVMKKDNDEIDAGKIQFTPNSSCVPSFPLRKCTSSTSSISVSRYFRRKSPFVRVCIAVTISFTNCSVPTSEIRVLGCRSSTSWAMACIKCVFPSPVAP